MPAFTSPAVMARLTSPLVLRTQCTRMLQNARFAADAPTRSSSMSAIVRGVRRSFRDPDGRRPPGRNPAVAAHVSERRRAREAAGPNTFKILRGKKDVTEPPIPKAKTRRARFFDPEEDYGKKSLVYQAKTGALEAEVNALRRELKPESRDDDDGWGKLDQQRQASGDRDDRRGFSRDGRASGFTSSRGGEYGRRPDARPRRYENDSRVNFNDRGDRPPQRSDDWTPRDPPKSRGSPPWAVRGSRAGRERRETFDDRESRPDDRRFDRRRDDRDDHHAYRPGRNDRNSRDDRPPRQSWGGGRDNNIVSHHNHNDSEAPLSMPYTTAASHFLYGRSVVEAALRSGRRKLYQLYIYGGSSKNSDARPRTRSPLAGEQPNEVVERLAKRKNVPVKIVDERWQRLLDKMSKGRPNNGIVLEASPLPQPPLVSLGRYKEPVGETPGFNISLDYQSREDAEINGDATFVPVRTPALSVVEQPTEDAIVEETAVDEISEDPTDEPVVADASTEAVSEAPSAEITTESTTEPAETTADDVDNIPAEPASETTDSNAITPASARTKTPPRFYRPLVVLLEQVLDPGNLGAILRSASFLGVSAVVVSRHGSATMSSVALKASAGASEDLPLFTVDKPAEFLAQSRKFGWRVYSTVSKPSFPGGDQRKSYDLDGLEKADPLRKQPCILVIGSEGEGLSRAIRRKADAEVTISNQSGTNTVDSLNVSVATGLVCASFLRGATRASNEAEREAANDIDEFESRPNVKDELEIW